MIANFAAITTILHLKYLYLLMISTHIHKYDDVLQKVYSRIWSGRQRPSLHVLPQTSEKITNHTISMNGRQCIQPIPSKKVTSSPLSLHPSFFSQKATLFHERKPFFPRQAHTSLQQQQSFFIKLLLIPIFFKKEPSDNYR
jgi:hypothetical protein